MFMWRNILAMNWILYTEGLLLCATRLHEIACMSMWRKILAMNWILLHRGFTFLWHKITRDYMYVNVKKCPSHEMDTFAPRVYFSVPQDYTRLHVCQCEKMSWPWNGYFFTEGLLLCATRLHEITCMSMWRNILAMNWILLHQAFTSMCHKITRDYMYVNVRSAVCRHTYWMLDTFFTL